VWPAPAPGAAGRGWHGVLPFQVVRMPASPVAQVSSACHAASFIMVMMSLLGSGTACPHGQGRRTRNDHAQRADGGRVGCTPVDFSHRRHPGHWTSRLRGGERMATQQCARQYWHQAQTNCTGPCCGPGTGPVNWHRGWGTGRVLGRQPQGQAQAASIPSWQAALNGPCSETPTRRSAPGAAPGHGFRSASTQSRVTRHPR
jgi:hypothetical protein